MIITFLANAAPHPIGGAIAIFELANGLARRGHEVHVVHLDFAGNRVHSPEDLAWFAFERRLHHHFPESFSDDAVPRSDFVVCFDDRIPRGRGLPLSLVMGSGGLPGRIEAVMLAERCPKLCISRYLVGRLAERGVPGEQLQYLPMGIDRGVFRINTPLEDRPAQVAMRLNSHVLKGMIWGIRALAIVRRQMPDVRLVLYGRADDPHRLPAGANFLASPSQDVLVREVYNQSRLFVCSSRREGFGMPSAEAMACGCALVTTDNGGSREFAIHGVTALVCQSGDAEALAAHILSLLRDDEERRRLARAGHQFVQRFDWDESARLLDEFLASYARNPERFQVTGLADRDEAGAQ